ATRRVPDSARAAPQPAQAIAHAAWQAPGAAKPRTPDRTFHSAAHAARTSGRKMAPGRPPRSLCSRRHLLQGGGGHVSGAADQPADLLGALLGLVASQGNSLVERHLGVEVHRVPFRCPHLGIEEVLDRERLVYRAGEAQGELSTAGRLVLRFDRYPLLATRQGTERGEEPEGIRGVEDSEP